MSFTPKRLIGLGLGAALLGTVGLSACSGEAGEAADTPHATAAAHSETGEGGEGEGGEGSGHNAADMDALPVEERVAFMSGHVAAGLALYRAGAPDQAARHLLHPVSETHAAERAGIDALGFTPDVFEQVSKALEDGKPASEIEPLLAAAETNIKLLQQNAGGKPAALIDFLMNTCLVEYQAGVEGGLIVNAGEFQDAYGFSVTARNIAMSINNDPSNPLTKELEVLVAMWPGSAPLADSSPAPLSEIAAQIARVKLELSIIE